MYGTLTDTVTGAVHGQHGGVVMSSEVTWGVLGRRYWVDYVVVGALLVFVGVLAEFVEPYHRQFPIGYDTVFCMTSYEHWEHPLAPYYVLFIITLLLPTAVFGLSQIWLKSRHDFHHATLALFTAFAFVMVFTEMIKNQAGRYRPDYYWRESTGDEKTIRDGRYSFPSGHSSVSFGCLVVLSCYILSKFKVFTSNGGGLWKVAIAMIPMEIAWIIAVSRTMDNHHNFSDIVAGLCLGLPIGVFSYFLYYPPLNSPDCDIPKLYSVPSQQWTSYESKENDHL